MAYVVVRSPNESNRGQLILVTGLLVAATIVTLVLLLNTAIYTENLASRGTDQSGREAVEYRATVIQGVEGLVEAEHNQDHDDHVTLWANVRDGIIRIDNLTARSYATRGTIVRIDEAALVISNGTSIGQSTDRSFENASDEGNWTLVEDVHEVRSFNLSVDPDVSTNESMAIEDGSFNVTIADGSTRQQYFVYENDSSVEIAVRTDDGDIEKIHESSNDKVEIDFANRSIDDTAVPELDWTDEISTPYQIEYRNGNRATGKYGLTVNSITIESDDYGGGLSYEYIVYRIELPLSYKTSTLTYRTTVQFVPGESA